MPDPPSSEPLEEGQPEAKKQKVESEDADEGWEAVEKPEGADLDGVIVEEKGDEFEKLIEAEEAKEEQSTALHTAEAGVNPPQNNLLKDW